MSPSPHPQKKDSAYLVDSVDTTTPNLLTLAVHLTVYEPVHGLELASRRAVVPVRALTVAIPPVLAGQGIIVLHVGGGSVWKGESMGVDFRDGDGENEGEYVEG